MRPEAKPWPTKGDSAEDVMQLIAGAKKRIHHNWYFNGRFWVQTIYAPGRGWWSVLWPWPETAWGDRLALQYTRVVHRQWQAGSTLPIFCKTAAEAAEWAWQLAWIKELNSKKDG